ncbi:hypothetical protein Z043_113130, partial [Scleropages formosus]
MTTQNLLLRSTSTCNHKTDGLSFSLLLGLLACVIHIRLPYSMMPLDVEVSVFAKVPTKSDSCTSSKKDSGPLSALSAFTTAAPGFPPALQLGFFLRVTPCNPLSTLGVFRQLFSQSLESNTSFGLLFPQAISSADSTGDSMRSTVRKAAKLAVHYRERDVNNKVESPPLNQLSPNPTLRRTR